MPAKAISMKPSPAASSATKSKVIHLMRHGVTEMNVHLTKYPYGSRGFKDPLLFDTRLTPDGAAGARAAASVTAKLTPQPELAFPHHKGPVTVEPLARERVWLSSDCGRAPAELQREFPDGRFRFDHLPDIWWFNGDSADPKNVLLEPQDGFKARVGQFKQYLLERPEGCVAVVAHWGLLLELTGGWDFENCEVQSFRLFEDGTINQDW